MHNHDFDWAAMADELESEAEVYLDFLDQAFDRLDHPAPERILDIGSGPGVAACLLAQRFPGAKVLAADGSPDLLARAAQRAARLGVQIRTVAADFPDDLAELPDADIVWSSHAMHHVGDQLDALHRLAARVRPGGVLAIAEGGLPARSLPRDIGLGRPGLQSRLDAVMTERFNRMRSEVPDSVSVVEDWAAMLRGIGLNDVRTQSFLVDHPAPVDERTRRYVRRIFERFTSLTDLMDPDDLDTLQRLLDPDDPAGIDRRPDVFLLAARTVHYGRRADD